MKLISLRIPETLDARIRAASRRRGAGRSALIRETLSRHVGEEDRIRRGSFLELAADLAGCLRGSSDLSSKAEQLRSYGR